MGGHEPIRVVIEGEPASKARVRFSKRGSKVHAFTPEKTKQAEEAIAWHVLAAKQPWMRNATAYGVKAHFYCGTWQRRDIDNMLKLVLDGCNKVVWDDDCQVIEISAKLERGADHARTEFEIWPIDGAKTPPTVPCAECGAAIRVYGSQMKNATNRYCSKACQTIGQTTLEPVPCMGCGEPIMLSRSARAKNPNRHCSRGCLSRSTMVDIECAGCGKQEQRAQSLVRKGQRTYCSPECKTEFWRKRRSEGAKGECVTCGEATSKKQYVQCRACFEGERLRAKQTVVTISEG